MYHLQLVVTDNLEEFSTAITDIFVLNNDNVDELFLHINSVINNNIRTLDIILGDIREGNISQTILNIIHISNEYIHNNYFI